METHVTTWPIERKWLVHWLGSGLELSTADLSKFRACAMLGPAGVGKTYEWQRLAEAELNDGNDVRSQRLAELGVSPSELEAGLRTLSANTTARSVIYLDALDECLIPLPQASILVANWVRKLDPSVRLRLSCRSAVFPTTLEETIKSRYSDFAAAALLPLSPDDIIRVADSLGVDGRRFLELMRQARAETIAAQPLTLELLVELFKTRSAIPQTRHEVFETASVRLLRERAQRIDEGLANDVSVNDLTRAAEELACLTLLAGLEAVYTGDSASPAMLSADEIHRVRPALSERILRAFRNTGLVERAGDHAFRFVHRQFAEFFAGRRIARLLPHQARALLASPSGWKQGPAGPFREVAAFASAYNQELAEWVATADPEIVGLSDVADDRLRKRAMFALFDQLRTRAITASQFRRGGIELRGLRYEGVERDLEQILRSRSTESPEVLIAAIEMVDAWRLTVLTDVLAETVLDAGLPLRVRQDASYSIVRFGSASARLALKPLRVGVPDDAKEDLKGNALRALWPDHLTTSELLDVLTPPRRRNYGGAYQHFLYELARTDFAADDAILKGLSWARQFVVETFESDPLLRVSKRITRNAFRSVGEDVRVRDAVADLLLLASEQFAKSPLRPDRPDALSGLDQAEIHEITIDDQDRRLVIDTLVDRAKRERDVWWAVRDYLLQPQDLEWLFEKATDDTQSPDRRRQYADLARYVPAEDESRWVAAWLAVKDQPILGAKIPFALSCPLYGEEADELRARHQRAVKPPEPRRIDPGAAISLLEKAEKDDPRFFRHFCRALRAGFDDDAGRQIILTDLWRTASDELKDRILAAAKRLLLTGGKEAKDGAELSNQIPIGYMEAAWLLVDEAPQWLASRPQSWWALWAKYFLAHTHPNMMGESLKPKNALIGLLYDKAPDAVRRVMYSISTDPKAATSQDSQTLLDLISSFPDALLDEQLSEALKQGVVPADRVRAVAEFVLRRDASSGLVASVVQLNATSDDTVAVAAAVALLSHNPDQAWLAISEYLGRRPDLVERVLGEFAYRRDTGTVSSSLSPSVAGEILSMLFQAFPPESDPVHTEGYTLTPAQAARDLRSRLLNFLTEKADLASVSALRRLERTYGAKYAWLSAARAEAERSFKLKEVSSVSPEVVAQFLDASEKRLVRSVSDALDGVEEAIRRYASALKSDRMNDRDDLWNRPRDQAPTPKDEERASDKVRDAIAGYFREYAVAAEREVQLYRRMSSSEHAGRPGSQADVFTLIPAAGTTWGDRICIPVEVKYAHNAEAKTALVDQLNARYLPESGTDAGVFALVWMSGPGLHRRYRPQWPSTHDAEAALIAQADTIRRDNQSRDIRVVLIDASLPTVGGSPVKGRRKLAGISRSGGSSRTSGSGAKPAARSGAKPTPERATGSLRSPRQGTPIGSTKSRSTKKTGTRTAGRGKSAVGPGTTAAKRPSKKPKGQK